MLFQTLSPYLLEKHFLIIISIVYIVYQLINYFKMYYSMPRGPLPLPFLGHVLHFTGDLHSTSPAVKMYDWAKKYGSMFTIWVGSKPIVVINDYKLTIEASVEKRREFANRNDDIIHNIIRDGTQNISSSSGPHWEALKKIGVFATRKFQSSERLPEFAAEVCDEAVLLMLRAQQPINPIIYVDYMIYNMLAYCAYGERFGSIDDQLFRNAKKLNEDLYTFAGNGFIGDYIRWLRPFYRYRERAMKSVNDMSVHITNQQFLEHKKDFTPGILRDFSDCVLKAKETAIRENYWRKEFLNDDNLYMVVNDLFMTGTDTTQTTMRWALLFLANDPKLQQNIYEEIDSTIGDRIPRIEDKDFLPQIYSFILEVLRFRPSAPFGIDHSNSADAVLGGYHIPANTRIVFNVFAQNNDPKYWTNPEQFDPTRFIDSEGKVISGKLPSFVTFGIGPRLCPGMKMAIHNLFLMLTRVVQNIRFTLSTGDYSADLQPINIFIGLFPKDYQIVCNKRNK